MIICFEIFLWHSSKCIDSVLSRECLLLIPNGYIIKYLTSVMVGYMYMKNMAVNHIIAYFHFFKILNVSDWSLNSVVDSKYSHYFQYVCNS